MTTREAFKKLIHIRGIHHKLGISSGLVRIYRFETPSIEKMEELLSKAGWTKKPEVWTEKN